MRLLCSFFVMLLTGCSSTINSVDALSDWDKKYSYCYDVSKNSDFVFPRTQWFDSLEKKDKQRVVIYLYQLKAFECHGNEAETLELAWKRAGINHLITLFEELGVFKVPEKELVIGLDMNELDKLNNKTPTVFNLSRVAKQLNFYN